MKAAALILGSVLLLAPGCKREAPPPPPAPAPVATAPPVEPAAAAGNRKMAHCPSSVAGAKTTHAAVAGGVDVTITSTSPAAVTEIRDRAKHLVEVAVKDPAAPKHSGEGEGGGMLGQCPVVLNDTTLVATDVDNGVKVTVKPNKAENVEWLVKEVATRAAKPMPQ